MFRPIALQRADLAYDFRSLPPGRAFAPASTVDIALYSYAAPDSWPSGQHGLLCAGAVDRAVATAVTGGHPCVKFCDGRM